MNNKTKLSIGWIRSILSNMKPGELELSAQLIYDSIPQIKPTVDNQEILRSAIEHYGVNGQIMQAVEEMAELMQALSKYMRHGQSALPWVIEELADAQIMIDQLRIIFDDGSKVDTMIDSKIARLKARMMTNSAEGK